MGCIDRMGSGELFSLCLSLSLACFHKMSYAIELLLNPPGHQGAGGHLRIQRIRDCSCLDRDSALALYS